MQIVVLVLERFKHNYELVETKLETKRQNT